MSTVVFPAPRFPMEVARQIVHRWTRAGVLTLRRWRGDWYEWTGPRWQEIEFSTLRSKVYAVLESALYENDDGELVPWAPNRRKVGDVLEALDAVALLDSRTEPHTWLGDEIAPAHEIIACENTLVHVTSRQQIAHTPKFWNLVAVPFPYAPEKVPTPAWDGFLDSVWGDDAEAIAALQEWTGYVLSGRTDLQKMMMIIGPTRSGKGTIARALNALVGRENVAGPTLSSLGQNFGLAPLVGKSLAMISDARMSGDTHTVVERLLSISGEDTLTIDRKYREPWTGRISARIAIMSNELPRLGDASGALANRMIVITMNKSFLGREDRTLDRRISAELPGILNWALDGLDRLTTNGTFTVPESSQAFVQMMGDLASPISAFLRQETVKDSAGSIPTDDLYAAWSTWVEENGHRRTSKSVFVRDVKSAAAHVEIGRNRQGASRVKVLRGIRFRSLAEPVTEPTIGKDPDHVDPPALTSGNADEGGISTRTHPEPAPTHVDPPTPEEPQVNGGGTGWPTYFPIVGYTEPDAEVQNIVLGSLSTEFGQTAKNIAGSVPKAYREQTDDVLQALLRAGLATLEGDRYLRVASAA